MTPEEKWARSLVVAVGILLVVLISGGRDDLARRPRPPRARVQK